MRHFKAIRDFFTNQRTVFWILLGMLILPNLFMFFTESTSTLTRICNILLPLSLYWFAFTLGRKPGKAFLWMFYIAAIDAFQIVLLYLYGESPIAVDMFLNVATTNVNEAGELLSNILVSVIFVAVVYLGGIALSIYSIVNKQVLNPLFRAVQRKVSLMVMGLSIALIGVNYLVDYKHFAVEDDIFPINGTYNLLLSFKRSAQTVAYSYNSENFSYHATSMRSDTLPEVYVMVIGETARADNFGLYGYTRNTTPQLNAMRDEIIYFRDAVTMSNTTHKSVPLLLTSVGGQRDFDSVYYQKGIISAFNEAGYNTAFFSNQRRNHSLIDFLGDEAKHVDFLKDNLPLTANLPDEKLLDKLNMMLSQAKGDKLFIVLHCYGSHFLYKDRYVGEKAIFTPDRPNDANKKYRSLLLNAYDNTIYYTDHLLAHVISSLKAKHMVSAMFFVSDHGEDIFDDSRARFLHASPLPTYYQLRVPMIMWTSPEWRAAHADKWQALQGNRNKPVSTNRVMFHTVLDMCGIKTSYYNPSNSVSSMMYRPSTRLYVDDHNDYLPMLESGLKKCDIEQFKKHNLAI